MKLSTLLLAPAALSAAGVATKPAQLNPPYCPPREVEASQLQAIFQEAIQKLFVDRNGTQYALDHLAEDYIQRNPYALSGRDNTVTTLAFVSPNTVNFTILNTALQGNIGFVHYTMELSGEARPPVIGGEENPTVVVDVMRFNGSCIQEHWDVMQQRPDDATNPLEMW
ncbi:membrane protein [Colletotrichum plurivorum]|uniref:Membrane protein n=1 Tax=Colletotrichum plurivorum TaxID=2175906 RepID=A0A8H6KQM9_9PEZI|nr:membrane protein [Colletotrichum plurivorum]